MRCWFYIYFKIEREISFKSFKLYSLLLSEIFEIDGFLNNQNGRNFFSIAPNACMEVLIFTKCVQNFSPLGAIEKKLWPFEILFIINL